MEIICKVYLNNYLFLIILSHHRRGVEEGAKKGESNTAVRTSIAGCGLGVLSLYHPPPDSYWECL